MTASSPSFERIDLAPLLAEWQPLLRLADWDIVARYVRHLDRCTVSYDAKYKHASIALVDPIDWPADATFPYDIEKHLVHELCHLHLAPLDIANNTPMHLHEEQAVESLARAFVALKRRTCPPAPASPVATPTP